VARVARQHDVSTALIYTWRRKAEVQAAAAPAEIAFVEAVVLDDGGSKQAPSPPAVVVDLPGGRRVNIYASAPPGVAAAVLKALLR
jgi:transposase